MVAIVNQIRYGADNNWTDAHYNKTLIVIHATVTHEEPRGARLVASWFNRPGFDASTQYVVDNREVVRCVPDAAYAWAAGTTANIRGIHIELVAMPGQTRSQWSDPYSDDELRLAARLVRELASEHGIPLHKIGPAQMRAGHAGVCGHDDVRDAWGETTHWDPGPHFPWDRFMRLVKDQGADITEEDEDMPTANEIWNHVLNPGAPDKKDQVQADVALRVAFNSAQRMEKRQRMLLNQGQNQTHRLRQAINRLPDGATKAEVKGLLEDLDATIRLVVNDGEEA